MIGHQMCMEKPDLSLSQQAMLTSLSEILILVTLNDPELQYKGFNDLFAILSCGAHFKSKNNHILIMFGTLISDTTGCQMAFNFPPHPKFDFTLRIAKIYN